MKNSVDTQMIDLILAHPEAFALKKKSSIFDIAGYPHYEIVSSNLLAFFLDPRQAHAYGAALLSILLELGRMRIPSLEFSVLNVSREVVTDRGNRIDIVVECDSFVVIIENKIYHYLANDLADYYGFVLKQNPGKPVLGVVLTIESTAVTNPNFRNVRHGDFHKAIRKNPQFSSTPQTDKYHLFFLDYMESIATVAQESKMDEELCTLIDQHRREIGQFYLRVLKLCAEMDADVRTMRSNLSDSSKDQRVHIWENDFSGEEIYFQRAAVVDIKLKAFTVALCVIRDYKGWSISVFERNDACIASKQVIALMRSRSLKWIRKDHNNRLVYKEFPIEAREEVERDVLGLVGKVLHGA